MVYSTLLQTEENCQIIQKTLISSYDKNKSYICGGCRLWQVLYISGFRPTSERALGTPPWWCSMCSLRWDPSLPPSPCAFCGRRHLWYWQAPPTSCTWVCSSTPPSSLCTWPLLLLVSSRCWLWLPDKSAPIENYREFAGVPSFHSISFHPTFISHHVVIIQKGLTLINQLTMKLCCMLSLS